MKNIRKDPACEPVRGTSSRRDFLRMLGGSAMVGATGVAGMAELGGSASAQEEISGGWREYAPSKPAQETVTGTSAQLATRMPWRLLERDSGGGGELFAITDQVNRVQKYCMVVAGSPARMGAAHGRLMRLFARRLVERVVYGIGAAEAVANGTWLPDTLAEIEKRTLPHIPPRFIEECDTMSDAIGISRRDGRYANLFPERFHCSGFAVRGTASVGGQILHARVLDYMRDIALQRYATVQIFLPDGYIPWMSLGYGGFIGTVTAMNLAGVAVGEMGGRGEGAWDGVPMSLLLRDVMERSETTEDAVKILRETPRTCEYYYVISDRHGSICGIRATPEELLVLGPGEQHPLLPTVPPDTVMFSAGDRAVELSRRLHERHGKIDVAAMIEMIRRPVAMQSNLHDAVFAPQSLEMWFADAGRDTPACDEPYHCCSLPGMIALHRGGTSENAETQ